MIGAAYEMLQRVWLPQRTDLTVTPLGDGHINDTLLVRLAGEPRYVLQRLNQRVFEQPQVVIGNLERILSHFADGDTAVQVPELMVSVAGEHWYQDDNGDYWRLWTYRQGTRTLTAPLSAAEVFAAAQAFGRFQRRMQSLPGPRLRPPIPGFLHLADYLVTLDEVASRSERRAAVADREFIDANRSLAARLAPAGDYIHGDCKLDNLLFKLNADEVDCVLDLDTVMPGHWAWDFGDLVRSVLTTQLAAAADGVADSLATELFSAAAAGFINGRGELPDPDAMLVAPVYVSFMLGVRFLSDHLAGDVYFKVATAGENLQRARAQFAIAKALQRQTPELEGLLRQQIEAR